MSGHGEAGAYTDCHGESERLLAAAFDIPAEVGEREARTWQAGAAAERYGARLLRRLPPDWHAWHDLAVPRSRATIDHLVAGPAGVYLIDSKVRRYPRGLAAEQHLARATLNIAARVSRRLGVEVDSVWAIFGRRPVLVADVEVIPADALVGWLCGQPAVFSAEQVGAVHQRVEAHLRPRGGVLPEAPRSDSTEPDISPHAMGPQVGR